MFNGIAWCCGGGEKGLKYQEVLDCEVYEMTVMIKHLRNKFQKKLAP